MEISVIIPVFNGEKYLHRCADSILKQTFTDFEVIFVNDGSKDTSGQICDEYAAADSRVKVIHKPMSEGAGPARNSGLDAAKGKFIFFLDADDHIEPDMFEVLLKAQQEQDYDLVICSYDSFVDGVDGYTDRENYEELTLTDAADVRKFFVETFPLGKVGYLWNKMYKADIIREKGLCFPDMRRLQDGVFNIGYFSCITTCRVIDRPLYHYMLNPQTGLFKKCPKDYFDLIKRFSTDFLDMAESWGFEKSQVDENITVFFLNELGNCLENAKSENWGINKAERKAYYAQLQKDAFVKETTAKKMPLGKYRKMMISLLMGGHFGLLSGLIGLKTGMKMRFKKIFYALKGRQSK